MANPTKKSEGLEQDMKRLLGFDRRYFIRQNLCVPAPYGCGQPVKGFRDVISEKEYRISGLCQACQDGVFNPPNEG